MSTNPPRWFTSTLCTQILAQVHGALPNEAAGLFIRLADGTVEARPAMTAASPDSFVVDADWLIQTAYRCDNEGSSVIGTYHSHPADVPRFSERDRPLFSWGSTHLLISGSAQSPTWLWVVEEFCASQSE